MKKRLGRLFRPSMRGYFIFMLLFAVATAIAQQYILAAVELVITGLIFTVYMVLKRNRRRELERFLSKQLDPEQKTGGKIPFPMVVTRLGDEGIIYVNDDFIKLTGFQDTMTERRISDMLPGFDCQWLLNGKTEYPHDVALQKRRYRVYGTVIQAKDVHATRLGVLYFTDLTELYQIRDEYIRSRPVVSLIVVDNYEELTKNMSEGATSAMNARINDAITQWTENYHGLLRRLERNRFLFVFEKRDLKQLVDGKFSLLEDIHEITNPAGLAASVSIGVGVDAETFEEAYQFASLSIEMSLSRGGDQAVVKDRVNFHFYGGRTKEAERHSKVRSRVTANSLMELIGQSSQVFIMGHKNADLDAVGAAMGIACLCRKKGKPAYIVLDLENNAAQKLIEEIMQVPEYKNVFISGQDALLYSDNRSTLVVVDTNRPDQVECQPLLETVPRICVVDHHRRAADYIKPVVVNLHEPYASSAAELVTELLEYAVEKKDVLPIEAKSLMAGIFLDTKSFNVRTGERTFEAAAFLRQLGADTVDAKKLLQNDFEDTKRKYQIIKATSTYRGDIAIAPLDTTVPRTLAAQAADELLNIEGFTSSFVLFADGDTVFVSARSIGDTNVQVILEELGGGGNAATAGAQIKGSTVREVTERLRHAIDKFFEE